MSLPIIPVAKCLHKKVPELLLLLESTAEASISSRPVSLEFIAAEMVSRLCLLSFLLHGRPELVASSEEEPEVEVGRPELGAT